MPSTPFTKSKTSKHTVVLIGAGFTAFTFGTIAAVGLRLNEIDSKGAAPESLEFRAAANWVNANNAQYCDMSAEQTLLHLAKKAVPGLLTPEESTARVASAALELSNSANPRDRADGLYVRALQLKDAAETEIQQLTALAKLSVDPSIYATALEICSYFPNESCREINAQTWISLDPKNGVPWLALANTALDRKDDETAKIAIQNALSAENFKSYASSTNPIMKVASISALPAYNREMIGVELTSLPQIDPHHQLGVIRYCVEKGKPRQERSELCNAMAKRLAKDDPSWEGAATAAAIAKRFNWDAAQAQKLEKKKQALSKKWTDLKMDNAAPYMTCFNGNGSGHGTAFNRLFVPNPLVAATRTLAPKPTSDSRRSSLKQ